METDEEALHGSMNQVIQNYKSAMREHMAMSPYLASLNLRNSSILERIQNPQNFGIDGQLKISEEVNPQSGFSKFEPNLEESFLCEQTPLFGSLSMPQEK